MEVHEADTGVAEVGLEEEEKGPDLVSSRAQTAELRQISSAFTRFGGKDNEEEKLTIASGFRKRMKEAFRRGANKAKLLRADTEQNPTTRTLLRMTTEEPEDEGWIVQIGGGSH